MPHHSALKVEGDDMLNAGPIDICSVQAEGASTTDAEDVTATVTSGAQPASDPPTVTDFMSAVVAWPGSNEPGFVNLHYLMPDHKQPGKLLKGMGWPITSVDKLVERAAWINTVPDKFKDVWFCTSLQSKMGNNSKGKPKAVRLAANALKVKSIWIDIDVGVSEPGKKPKYPDVQTALKAALAFAKKVGLPEPSAVVFSGGGVHVYW